MGGLNDGKCANSQGMSTGTRQRRVQKSNPVHQGPGPSLLKKPSGGLEGCGSLSKTQPGDMRGGAHNNHCKANYIDDEGGRFFDRSAYTQLNGKVGDERSRANPQARLQYLAAGSAGTVSRRAQAMEH